MKTMTIHYCNRVIFYFDKCIFTSKTYKILNFFFWNSLKWYRRSFYSSPLWFDSFAIDDWNVVVGLSSFDRQFAAIDDWNVVVGLSLFVRRFVIIDDWNVVVGLSLYVRHFIIIDDWNVGIDLSFFRRSVARIYRQTCVRVFHKFWKISKYHNN